MNEDYKARRAMLALKARLAHRARLAHKVFKGRRGRKAQQGKTVLLDKMELPVRQVRRDQRDLTR